MCQCNKSQRKSLRFIRNLQPCLVRPQLVLTASITHQQLQVYQHVSSLDYLILEIGHRSPLIIFFYHSAGCKDYWSDLFIEWRADAHLNQHCLQWIAILQLPLSWNHGHWCWKQNVLLHSLLGVSFTHRKRITLSKEMHYNLVCDCLSIPCLLLARYFVLGEPAIF